MSKIYRCQDGDVLDRICWQYYGVQARAVEAVLAANPNLADRGHVYTAGTMITLPDLDSEVLRPRQQRQIRIFNAT